jgi:hypothetical protein
MRKAQVPFRQTLMALSEQDASLAEKDVVVSWLQLA